MGICIMVGVLVVCTVVLVLLLGGDNNNSDSGLLAQEQHKLTCLEIALTGKYDRD